MDKLVRRVTVIHRGRDEPRPVTVYREPADREYEAAGKPQLVLVDLARRQTPRQLKRLRRGRGALVTRIDEIVEELVQAGTVKANAQPVVIVVREKVALPWPFANMDYDE